MSEAKDTAPDSMRAQFTTDDNINGLHGSSSPAEAVEELNFFFPAVSFFELQNVKKCLKSYKLSGNKLCSAVVQCL